MHSRARRIDSFASRVTCILLVINNFFELSKMSHLTRIKTTQCVDVVYELVNNSVFTLCSRIVTK